MALVALVTMGVACAGTVRAQTSGRPRTGVRMTHAEGAGLCFTPPSRSDATAIARGTPTTYVVAQAESVFVAGERATSIRLRQHSANRTDEITLVTLAIPQGDHLPPSGRRLVCTAPGEAPATSDYARVCQLTRVCGDRAYLVTAYRAPGRSPSCGATGDPRRACPEAHLLARAVTCHDGLAGLSLPITSGRDVTIARLDLQPGYQPCDVRVTEDPEWSSETHAGSWRVHAGAPDVRWRVTINDRAHGPTGAVVGTRLGEVFGRRRRWLRLEPSSSGDQVLHHRALTPGAHVDFEAACRGPCAEGSLAVFRNADLWWEPDLAWIIRGSAGVVWLPEQGTFGGLLDLTLPLYRVSGEALLGGLHFSGSRVGTDYFFTLGAAVELDLSYFWRRDAGGRDRDVQLVIGVHLGLAAALITDEANTYVAPGFDLTPYVAPRLRLGTNVFLAPRLEVGWAFGDTTRLHASLALGAGVQW